MEEYEARVGAEDEYYVAQAGAEENEARPKRSIGSDENEA